MPIGRRKQTLAWLPSCLLLLLLLPLSVLLVGCGNQPKFSIDDVQEVRYGQPASSGVNWRLATDAEVERFVRCYSEARGLADDFGTTHPAVVQVTLESGEVLRVWGGGEEFQTVTLGEQQWNIESALLHGMMRQIAAGESNIR